VTRRRSASLAAVLAVPLLLLATPVAAQPGTQLGDAAGCGSASPEAPVRIEVRTLAPRAPQRPDQPFQVAGRLVNCGSEPLRDLEVRLGVGPRLNSRSLVRRADEEPVAGARRLAQPPVQPGLEPGGTTGFDLRLPVSQLRLGTLNGVFALTVQVRGRVGAESARLQVGLAHTFVPWFPDGPIAPTRVAWALPLVDVPHRGPGEVMLDDELDSLLASEGPVLGRLHRALTAGAEGSAGGCDPPAAPVAGAVRDAVTGCRGEPVPMTYAVDPDLLYTVEALTRRHTVLERGARTDREPSENAERWLARLRAETAGGADVLALPYADPDVVALTRSGSPVKDDVEALRRLGAAEAEELLGSEPLRSLAWVPPGALGGSVDALAGGEVTTLLVDAGALPDPEPLLRRTPNARTVLPTQTADVGALVIDTALSELLEADPGAPDWQGARLAEQRWIAELAALAAERPSTSRTVVVAPRRRADLQPLVVAGAVADTGRLPFVCPVSLAAAAAGDERCAVLPDTQGPAAPDLRGPARSRTEDDRELSSDQLRGLGQVRAASDQFTDQVLIADSPQAKDAKARLLRARGRAASTAWRDEPAGGRTMLRLLDQDVSALRAKVSLISSPVLLTGSVRTVPLTVRNELDQPVNVAVGLPDSAAARLESANAALQVIPPRRDVPVDVRVEARTSGRFSVQATLLDAEGQAFGPPVRLDVRSTQYGRAALAVTGLAAAVLMVAAGVRIARRALRRPPA